MNKVKIWWSVYYDFYRNQLVQIVEQNEFGYYTYYYENKPILTNTHPDNFGLIYIGDF
jgi:hypothetical protein